MSNIWLLALKLQNEMSIGSNEEAIAHIHTYASYQRKQRSCRIIMLKTEFIEMRNWKSAKSLAIWLHVWWDSLVNRPMMKRKQHDFMWAHLHVRLLELLNVQCTHHFQSLHHWIVPFFARNLRCHSTKETKLILISLAAWKWDRWYCCCCFTVHLHLYFSSSKKSHFSLDWWVWLATLQLLYVGLLFL